MLLAGRGYYRYPSPVNATLLHWGDGSLHGDTLLRQVVSLSDLLFVHQIVLLGSLPQNTSAAASGEDLGSEGVGFA